MFQEQIDDLLEEELIRPSLSPCGVPTLLVTKKNGEFQMCVDSAAINRITVKQAFTGDHMFM